MKIFLNKYLYLVILVILVLLCLFVYRNNYADTKLFGRTSSVAFGNDIVRQLANASARGQESKIEELVKMGADVNFVGKDGATPLVWAAGNNSLAGVKALIKNGANINADVLQNETLLTFMARSDSSHDKLFEYLLSNGADPNKVDKSFNSPLKVAVLLHSYNKVKLLLDHGADPNIMDKSQDRPILDSVAANDFDITLILLNHGDKLYPSPSGYSVQYEIQNFKKLQYLSDLQKTNLNQLKDKLVEKGYNYQFPSQQILQKAIYDGKTIADHASVNDFPNNDPATYYRIKYEEFIKKIDSGKLKYQDIK